MSLLGREIVFDIEIRDAAGALVWQRLAGRTTPMILRLEVIQPGREIVLRETWRSAAAGRYTITGMLLTDAEPLRTSSEPLNVN